ncbi:MAG: hypothetical protein P1U40_04925 [Coxiellaceae bacterium]|nr:hypothetical protein [Coxiellaceae bacterium]
MKTILYCLSSCSLLLLNSALANTNFLGPVKPNSHGPNAGVIIFQDLDNRVNESVTLSAGSLAYFGGTKNGDYCTNPLLHTHPLMGQYTFTLSNGLFAYQLHPAPVYKSFKPEGGEPITDVHCLEFIIQGGDHTFTPQVIAFNMDCSQNQQCVATSAAETVVVS